MRSARSSFATRSSTPSSTPLRPSFQASATRSEYPSIDSGAVAGTMSTAIWLPLRFSNWRSSYSRASRCEGGSVWVRSVTRAPSGGTATSAQARPATSSSAPNHSAENRCGIPAFLPLTPHPSRFNNPPTPSFSRRRRTELHLGRLRQLLFVFHGECRLDGESEEPRGEVARELTHRDVVLLHRLDVTVARHGDAVLRALDLRLEIAEAGVGLELRIVLRHHQQARERRGHLALRGDEFRECLLVGK